MWPYGAGKLAFHGSLAHLANAKALERFLRPARRRKWYVYAKRPFAGPKAVLAYLSRYTHRVAISNRRLIRADANTVTFKIKNYRFKGQRRHTTMTLATPEFIRRFLIHVLPKELHRIRHYGLLANTVRAANLARMRELLGVPESRTDDRSAEDGPETPCEPDHATPHCPRCGGTVSNRPHVPSCPTCRRHTPRRIHPHDHRPASATLKQKRISHAADSRSTCAPSATQAAAENHAHFDQTSVVQGGSLG